MEFSQRSKIGRRGNETDPALAALVHERLRQLPDLEAPATLVPRVMAAIQAKAKVVLPWWKRVWWTWPPAARLLSALVVICLTGGLVWLGSWVGSFDIVSTTINDFVEGDWFSELAGIWSFVEALAGALALVLRTAGALALTCAALVGVALYASTVGLGTLCYRLALNNLNK